MQSNKENHRKMFLKMANDLRVIIETWPSFSYLRTLKFHSEKERMIAEETLEIIPAHCLGWIN